MIGKIFKEGLDIEVATNPVHARFLATFVIPSVATITQKGNEDNVRALCGVMLAEARILAISAPGPEWKLRYCFSSYETAVLVTTGAK